MSFSIKLVSVIFAGLLFLNCKNKPEKTPSALQPQNIADKGLTRIHGQFIYYNGAGVIQTPSKIYGIYPTASLKRLDSLAQIYKKNATDMVSVTIKGTVTTQKDKTILWENKVKIVTILDVSTLENQDEQIVQ